MIITIINIVINLGWGWLLGWPWWLNLILGFCAGSGFAWGGQTNKVPVLSYLIWAIYMACTPVHFLGWPIWIGIVFGLITAGSDPLPPSLARPRGKRAARPQTRLYSIYEDQTNLFLHHFAWLSSTDVPDSQRSIEVFTTPRSRKAGVGKLDF